MKGEMKIAKPLYTKGFAAFDGRDEGFFEVKVKSEKLKVRSTFGRLLPKGRKKK